jgi:hypothetical protein
MRTLLFCTSYSESIWSWNDRWRRWLRAVLDSRLVLEKVLIVDDGSPLLPSWSDVYFTDALSKFNPSSNVEFHRFADRRGQHVNGQPFPGWYRSFSYAVLSAIGNGFDRIIHIEADAFLISPRIIDFFNEFNSGWTCLWCPTHSWPETTLQIITRDSFDSCSSFFSKPYSEHTAPPYRAIERLIPFTFVNKSFTGDRYGEISEVIPRNADYASQVRWGMGPEYYWWLPEGR